MAAFGTELASQTAPADAPGNWGDGWCSPAVESRSSNTRVLWRVPGDNFGASSLSEEKLTLIKLGPGVRSRSPIWTSRTNYQLE